jgi:hypothetical protein
MNEGLAWFAVLFMGVVILLHSIIVFVIFSQLGKRLKTFQPFLLAQVSRINSGTTVLRQLLAHLEGVPDRISSIEGRATTLLEPVNRAVAQVDRVAADALSAMRFRLSGIDRSADEVLSSFSNQTFRVHRAIVHPAIRLSSLLQSITTLTERIWGGRSSPASYPPDEEIFI